MTRQIESALSKTGVLTPQQVSEFKARATETGRSVVDIIVSSTSVTEQDIADAISSFLHIPAIRLAATHIEPAAVKLVPEALARRTNSIAVKLESSSKGGRKSLIVAMSDPSDIAAVQDIEFATGCSVKPAVSTRTEIIDAANRYYSPDSWLEEFLENIEDQTEVEILNTPQDEINTKDMQAPAVKLVHLILQQAIRNQSSDIHVEPTLHHVVVRNRVDGILKEMMHFPKWLHDSLVSRVKILAVMDITERRLPQDGRMKVSVGTQEIDLRISTLPAQHGEKIVIRILGSGRKIPSLTQLGFANTQLEAVTRAASQPQGLILVTGPTGSGKTTTLYSVLDAKKSPTINIVTVEDPIEIQMLGVTQVQVNPKTGLSFAACLRSILRQDPDVLLVGEIRDLETAEIAFNAAMTGHLVLSTLHTNGTVATIARLLDIGVDPYIIASSTSLILAQRLVRRLCPNCKEEYKPSQEELDHLHLSHVDWPFFRGKGCSQCEQSGYSGRIGLYEILTLNPAWKDLIIKKATENEMRRLAVKEGMHFLFDDAMDKLRAGVTTAEEVLRVVQIQEDGSTRCPQCGASVDEQFASCPFCTAPLKLTCSGCDRQLRPEWNMCPYCSTPAPRQNSKPVVVSEPQPLPASYTSKAPEIPLPPTAPKILIVDDDEIMRELVSEALIQMPMVPEILEADNGLDAVRAAQQHKPDAIVLDLCMPGIDGFAVCELLRKDVATAFIPIIMLTANKDEQARTRAFMLGTDDYMGKPFSGAELQARMGRLLRRSYGM